MVMENWKFFIFMILLLKFRYVNGKNEQQAYKCDVKEQLSNNLSDLIENGTTETTINCGIRCSNTNGCVSFAYNKYNKNCQIYNKLTEYLSLEAASNYKIYDNVNICQTWKVAAKTGTVSGANCDCSIYLIIHGKNNNTVSSKLYLDNPEDDFESGNLDVFDALVTEPINISGMVKLQIGNENSDGWFMEWLELTCKRNKKMWRFELNEFLDVGDPLYQSEYTLIPV